MLFICALALIFIGPKQLPEVAHAIGKFLNELRRASDEALSVFKEAQFKSGDFLKKAQEDLDRHLALDQKGETQASPTPADNKSELSEPSVPAANIGAGAAAPTSGSAAPTSAVPSDTGNAGDKKS
jgi:sec-independent protein translocase protein TatB